MAGNRFTGAVGHDRVEAEHGILPGLAGHVYFLFSDGYVPDEFSLRDRLCRSCPDDRYVCHGRLCAGQTYPAQLVGSGWHRQLLCHVYDALYVLSGHRGSV